MREMSTFILIVLCDRARRRGVEQVDYQVMDGRFLAQIKALLYELQPDILVIGRPIGTDSASSSLPQEELEQMIAEIQQQTHTTVHPVEIHVEA